MNVSKDCAVRPSSRGRRLPRPRNSVLSKLSACAASARAPLLSFGPRLAQRLLPELKAFEETVFVALIVVGLLLHFLRRKPRGIQGE